MNRTGRRQTGAPAFTLVEVIVALGLCVLLVVTLHQVLVQAWHTSRTLEDRAAAADLQTGPLELLAGDLAGRTAASDLRLASGRLTLTTAHSLQSPRLAARHGVQVAYAAESAPRGGRQLLRCEWAADDAPPADTGVRVANGLRTVEWTVFDGQTWHTTWPLPTPRAARALRVILRWADGNVTQRVFPLAPLDWRRHDA